MIYLYTTKEDRKNKKNKLIHFKRNLWSQCKCKKRYKDEHMVNHYRKIFEKERDTKLDYYYCSYCHGYHLTSLIVG